VPCQRNNYFVPLGEKKRIAGRENSEQWQQTLTFIHAPAPEAVNKKVCTHHFRQVFWLILSVQRLPIFLLFSEAKTVAVWPHTGFPGFFHCPDRTYSSGDCSGI
jgi:hypothetical protein